MISVTYVTGVCEANRPAIRIERAGQQAGRAGRGIRILLLKPLALDSLVWLSEKPLI